jgi:hypothetical protein
MGVASNPAGWREWTGATFEHTSRVLCRSCNSRLEQLERGVAPIILAMVGLQPVRLTAAEQGTLAQWIYKTGLMVSTTIGHEASDLPKSHYSDLAQTFDLPPGSSVWFGAVEDPAYQAAFWVQRFRWRDNELTEAEALVGEGYVFVLSITDIVGVVCVLDARQSPNSTDQQPFELGVLGQGPLLRIWPKSEHYSVAWPPSVKLTGSDFQHLAESLQRIDRGHGSIP